MSKEINYSTTTENTILGGLMNTPSFILETAFPLTLEDFNSSRNKIVFAILFNLAQQDCGSIDGLAIMKELEVNKEQLAVIEQSGGINSLSVLKETYNIETLKNYETHYKRLKKYSLLRDFNKMGIDTTRFYEDDFFGNSAAKLEEYTLDDMLDYYKEQINNLTEKYKNHNKVLGERIDQGLEELLEGYKLKPDYGAELDGYILNSVTRGARPGKFNLISAPTGHGKTRRMIGQACGLSLPRIEDDGVIQLKKEYTPILFICTEQSISEIRTSVIAYVSGVDEELIVTGQVDCTEEQKNRIAAAVQIIKLYANNFRIERLSDPSIGLLKSIMLQYIYKFQIANIFFDYIFAGTGVWGEYSGLRLRTDEILMMFSTAIKEVAVTYDVFITSGTQVTGDFSEPGFKDQSYLRGAKSIADKIDMGAICSRVPEKERESIILIVGEGEREPNIVTDIYKNRSGPITGMRIFSFFDFATCRITDLFMTDQGYTVFGNFRVMKEAKTPWCSFEELLRDDCIEEDAAIEEGHYNE